MGRDVRDGFREAHDAGHHGDGTKEDVLLHWAEFCADCNAAHHYTFGTGKAAIGKAN
jgi:hypothetical protein